MREKKALSKTAKTVKTLKTSKNCNISQDLIDNFTSVRAIIQYLIYRGSITVTFNFFPN